VELDVDVPDSGRPPEREVNECLVGVEIEEPVRVEEAALEDAEGNEVVESCKLEVTEADSDAEVATDRVDEEDPV